MGNAPQFDRPLTACTLCGSAKIRRFDRDFRGRAIFRCRECGLKLMNPPYCDAYLAAYYARYIPEPAEVEPIRQARRRMSKIDDMALVERCVEPGRLLSIGCGDGLELQIAAMHGWEAEGYDVDPLTTRRVAARTGRPVYCGDFFSLGLPSDYYDCVFMDQVLEHPKNPGDYLREAYRILRPVGVLFVGCPNIESIASQWKTLLGKVGLKRTRGKHYDTTHHLSYFSPWQLRRALRTHFGFEVVVIEGDPLSGQKPRLENRTRCGRLMTRLRRRFPVLEGTFRIVARKPGTAEPAPASGALRRAA